MIWNLTHSLSTHAGVPVGDAVGRIAVAVGVATGAGVFAGTVGDVCTTVGSTGVDMASAERTGVRTEADARRGRAGIGVDVGCGEAVGETLGDETAVGEAAGAGITVAAAAAVGEAGDGLAVAKVGTGSGAEVGVTAMPIPEEDGGAMGVPSQASAANSKAAMPSQAAFLRRSADDRFISAGLL